MGTLQSVCIQFNRYQGYVTSPNYFHGGRFGLRPFTGNETLEAFL